MSWQIFKDNIVRMSDNPDAIPDIDTVAKTYAREYDAAIKRGKDTIEGVSLQKGNVEIMESLFKAALQKGLTSTAPYDLVGEMGNGVLAYWAGAIMNNFPNPKTLPPGAVSNISVVSNVVMEPGQWNPPKVEEGPNVLLPDDPMTDPSNIGDDTSYVDGQFVLDSIGPSDGSVLLEMESRQVKEIKEVEVSLIENPEEIQIIENVPTESDEAAIDLERPNERKQNNNNWDDGNKTPVRIYSNVGKDAYPVPPGYKKYNIPRTTKREDGVQDGPGGNVPSEALAKLSIGGHYAHPEAAKFMNLLIAAAKKAGVIIDITSSYRDYATGIRLWNENEKKGTRGNAAHPGHSAHGFAGAIDVGSLWQAQTDAAKKLNARKTSEGPADYVRKHSSLYAWLSVNGPKYGWYNPARLGPGCQTQEAWHWEYWGFYTLSKEERQASGATSVPAANPKESNNKQIGNRL